MMTTTMRRRHTTRMMAAGLALGLLALSSPTPPAHAQVLRCGGPAPVNADRRYEASIPGAVVCPRAAVQGSGEWFYTYDVTFARSPDALFSYTITDGAAGTAQGLSVSRARFDLWRGRSTGRVILAHYHRNHWLVLTRSEMSNPPCIFHAGGVQGQRVFEVWGGFADRHRTCQDVEFFEPAIIRGLRAALW